MRPLLSLLKHPPPFVPLGHFPSPVEWRDDLGAALGFETVCIKRDDLNSDQLGGNKVRALEWIFGRVGPSVVSYGGFGSTHAAALAIYARQTGRHTAVALFPQPWTDGVPTMLRRTGANAAVFLAPSRMRLPLVLSQAWRSAAAYGKPSWVPSGGAEPLGILGTVNAALEFVGQVDRPGGLRPDAFIVPLGSGGTAAGLFLGLRLAGWSTPVCAVPVTDRIIANAGRVRWLVWRTRRLLGRHGVQTPLAAGPLHILAGHLGQGYGHPTPQGISAQHLAGKSGLRLDLTYGAKAFGALSTLAGSYRRPCFWHTFDGRVEATSSGADPLLERARAYSEALWPFPRST